MLTVQRLDILFLAFWIFYYGCVKYMSMTKPTPGTDLMVLNDQRTGRVETHYKLIYMLANTTMIFCYLA